VKTAVLLDGARLASLLVAQVFRQELLDGFVDRRGARISRHGGRLVVGLGDEGHEIDETFI
jgi:hypothetical protein